MMTPDIEKIEHLLNAKTFEALTAPERELVLAHLSGAAEYEHMRETLVRVRKVFVDEAAALQADADLKEQILLRFEQNKPKSTSLSDKISTFFQTLIPSPTGRFAGALGLVVICISIGFFVWPEQQPEMAQQTHELFPKASQPQIVTIPDTTSPITLKTLEVYDEASNMPALSYNTSSTEDLEIVSSAGSTAPEGFIASQAIPVETEARGEEKAKMALSTAEERKANGVTLGESNNKMGLYAPPDNNNTYYNTDGFRQYSNSRVAQLPPKNQQLFEPLKDSNSFKKSEAAKWAKDQTADQKQYDFVKQTPPVDATGQTLTQIPGVTATGASDKADNTVLREEMVVAAKKTPGRTANQSGSGNATRTKTAALVAPMPAWPGTETRSDAQTLTQESVKAFFDKQSKESYRALTQTQNQAYSEVTMVSITLTFNSQGVITKVHVSGTTDDRQKKAFIQRALQLPTFKFTTGEGKPVLEQTYLIPVR